MQILRRNLGYKLISVIIAVLLYIVANNQLNPRTTNDVYVVPEVEGIPMDLVVRAGPPGFSVTVAGLTSSVATFKSEPVKATVDLSHAHLGTQKLPIHYKLPSGDIDDSAWPVSAEVTLEQKARHDWYVDVQYEAEPPPGYAYLDPVATPSQVKVAGLSSDVHRVARVIAVVPKDAASGDIDQGVDLVAQDERRQTVDTVQIEPDRVQVHIGLKPAETTKSLLLSPSWGGQTIAAGFAIKDCTFRPFTLTLTGTQESLRQITRIDVPVVIPPGTHESFTRKVHVNLPAGVSLQNPGDANVEVHVEIGPVAGAPTLSTPAPRASLPAAAAVVAPVAPVSKPSAP